MAPRCARPGNAQAMSAPRADNAAAAIIPDQAECRQRDDQDAHPVETGTGTVTLADAMQSAVEVLRFKPLLIAHSLRNFVGRRNPGSVRPTDPRVVGMDVGRPLENSKLLSKNGVFESHSSARNGLLRAPHLTSQDIKAAQFCR